MSFSLQYERLRKSYLSNILQQSNNAYNSFDIFDILCIFYGVFCCSFLGNISFLATLKFEKE